MSTPRTNQLLLSFFKTSALSGGRGGVGWGDDTVHTCQPACGAARPADPDSVEGEVWWNVHVLDCHWAHPEQINCCYPSLKPHLSLGWGGVGWGWEGTLHTCQPACGVPRPADLDSVEGEVWWNVHVLDCHWAHPEQISCCSPSLKPQLSLGWGGVGWGWEGTLHTCQPACGAARPADPDSVEGEVWWNVHVLDCHWAHPEQISCCSPSLKPQLSLGWGGVGWGWEGTLHTCQPACGAARPADPDSVEGEVWWNVHVLDCHWAHPEQISCCSPSLKPQLSLGWGGVGWGWEGTLHTCQPACGVPRPADLDSVEVWWNVHVLDCHWAHPEQINCCSPSLKPQLSLGWGGVG